MPRRAATVLLAACLSLACALSAASALAAEKAPAGQTPGKQTPSKQAQDLRQTGDLVPYAPGPEVLNAYFTADENAPTAVYGPVSAYAKARACKASWLIEKGELTRVERLKGLKDIPPFEFSVTLEEDCPGKVTHSVFVTSPGSTPEAWLKWRSQFHGRKAEVHYGAALQGLKKAEAAGLGPTAELRFVSVNGELDCRNLEDALKAEGRVKPVFDLVTGERVTGESGKGERAGR
jgi:hypothetical protein